jgi:adenosine deaminase
VHAVRSRFHTMPKVELHLHLEGAVPRDALWDLIESRGGDPDVPDPGALKERFSYRSFAEFIGAWVWKNRFLDTYRAFEFAAEAVAADLARQHIVYAEVFFSPTDFAHHGLTPEELAVSIRRGLDRVSGAEVALIVDLVRDTGPEHAARTFDRVAEVSGEAGIIGIGIGGSEAEYPPEQFAPVYRRAAGMGFRLTAHAGEAAGPESVWGALEALGVERIGHGVRSVEDDSLMTALRTARIPLEVCPTSNLRTAVVRAWDEHPVRTLVEAGVMVTINTDDPAMFGCTLAGEYDALATRLGFDDTTLRRLSEQAVDASWAEPARVRRLHQDLAAWWAANL